VQPRDLLVQVLGQHVDLLAIGIRLAEQLDLGDHLVGERVRHHEARMPGSVAQVQQATLREEDDRVAVREAPLVYLRLDVDLLDPVDLLERRYLDFVVEVADVADDRLVLHLSHVVRGDHVLVPGCGDEDVRVSDHALERANLIALHGGLEGADRVDLGDDHPGALPAQ
jgi:hypothetical protein